ncbi:Choline kinase 1 [Heracleum sosnowskyi]|uniref:Choline kinase 1 n=1 Tax=Heracleum sosnowskyi TaxID=360622 RepID=A0AAD8HBC8_9APIA|nr:Choline kinase 1 [Heracleum sosnowskyi]
MAVKTKWLAEGILPEELKKVLSSVAAKWRDVIDFNMLKVIHLSGAMTNEVYRITWPTTDDGLRNVLLRIYGEGVDVFFDRDEEIQTFDCLSKHGHGPRLLGQFTEGRVEEFIHAKTLSASDLHRMRNWLTKARNLCSNECAKEFHMDTLADEIDILEKGLSQTPGYCVLSQ